MRGSWTAFAGGCYRRGASGASAGQGRGMDQRPHVVVVEDETTQRDLLVDYLTRQNFRVSGVDGGSALRKLVERELPALVLLDIGLPGEDGFTLARWLRERSGRIGIIMVTRSEEHTSELQSRGLISY